MEIERINDNTVKFYLSYVDIEERGFTREEVWNNREKSEELFWDMIDEINEKAEFIVEGPLWIQVQAKKDGIEVTVTRTSGNHDEMFESSQFDEASNNLFQEKEDGTFESIEDLLNTGLDADSEWIDNTFLFDDFENVIQIASRMQHFEAHTSLYAYDSNYYLYVLYNEELMTNKDKTDMFSVLSEFAQPSDVTIHLLTEYGKTIFESDVFPQIEKYFK